MAPSRQDYFVKYYDSCMPLLKHIMQHANDKAHAAMRAKALECVSLVRLRSSSWQGQQQPVSLILRQTLFTVLFCNRLAWPWARSALRLMRQW